MHAPFLVSSVDVAHRELCSTADERIPFDRLILAPPQSVAPFLRSSGLAAENGSIRTDHWTLRVRDGISALGDNADLPAPKPGSAAIHQAKTVARNVLADLSGTSPRNTHDGSSECSVGIGQEHALMVETAQDRLPRVSSPRHMNLIKKRLLERWYFRLIRRR